jgi:tetratricopeptide (TPR) repeat protein
MEMYDASLKYWNKTLSGYSSNNTSVIDPESFYDHFSLAVKTYSKNNNPEGAIQFLKSAIKALPQYALEFHYYIAKVTLEKNLEKSIGKTSLLYCVEHFEPNVYFTKENMRNLVYAFDD